MDNEKILETSWLTFRVYEGWMYREACLTCYNKSIYTCKSKNWCSTCGIITPTIGISIQDRFTGTTKTEKYGLLNLFRSILYETITVGKRVDDATLIFESKIDSSTYNVDCSCKDNIYTELWPI